MELQETLESVIGATYNYFELLEAYCFAFQPNMYYNGKVVARYNKLLSKHGLQLTAKQPDGYVYIIKKGN